MRERLPLFLEAWREDRRLTDPRPLTDAHAVVLALVSRGELASAADPETVLRDHLEPVFAKTAEDAERFAALWKRMMGPERSVTPLPPTPPPGASNRVSGARAGRDIGWRWLSGLLTVAVLAGFGSWLYPIVTQKPPPPPQPEPVKEAPATVPASEPPPAPKPPDVPEAFNLPKDWVDWTIKPEVVPFLREVPWWETLLTVRTSIDWVIAAGPLLAFLILVVTLWSRAWFRDQVNYLTRHLGKSGHGRSEEFFLGLKREMWNPAAFLSGVVARLRRHQEEETLRLDPRRTVRATIRRSGFFTPVKASRPESPEYLFLTGERHRHDHLGRLVRQWIDGLRAHGVHVDEFRFARTPSLVYPAPKDEDDTASRDWTPRLRPLRDLAVRYARHRIVLFGEDLVPVNRYSGSEEPWVSLLGEWETERAVLTPPGAGATVAELRERGWAVFDFSESGVHSLGEWLVGEGTAWDGTEPGVPEAVCVDVPLWLGGEPPAPVRIRAALAELEAWLGPEGMRWLRACAAFPVIDWHLTGYLGDGLRKLSSTKNQGPGTNNAPPAQSLWRLAQLPWLREAAMPEWVRLELLKDFSAKDREAVGALLYLALRAKQPGGEEYALRVVAKRPRLVRRLSARLYRKLMRKYPELRDQLALTGAKGEGRFRIPTWITAGFNWLWPAALAVAGGAGAWWFGRDLTGGGLAGRTPLEAATSGQAIVANGFTFLPPGRLGNEPWRDGFWVRTAPTGPTVAAPAGPADDAWCAAETTRLWRAGALARNWFLAVPTKDEDDYAKAAGIAATGPVLVRNPDYLTESGSRAGEERSFEIAPGVSVPFVWCPPGTFGMGSPVSESGHRDDETLHEVTLTDGFWLAKTETTQEQWQTVMGSNPSKFTDAGPQAPVERVSHDDIQGFLTKINTTGAGGWRFTLPTEAQWEYACRAGTTGPFNADGADVTDLGWISDNSESKTHPVAEKRANAWGLFDLHGNVWEWCQDWYGDSGRGPGVDPLGAASGSYRVLRGGSWLYSAANARSANQSGDAPEVRSSSLGFRLARSSTIPEEAAGGRASDGALRRRGRVTQSRPKEEESTVVSRTLEIAPGVPMTFCYVPPGKFLMGSPKDEVGREPGSAKETQHEVTLTQGYWMARTETTAAQWRAIMGNNPSLFTDAGSDAPVEQVSWEEATKYAETLTAKIQAGGLLVDGWTLQLPTEAQWEYACRARTTAPHNVDSAAVTDLAWIDENSGETTHPVAGKRPNAFGLHDMLGNVFEWCRDWYQEDLGADPQTDPQDAASGSDRVYRGGSWYDSAGYARSASRDWGNPSYRDGSLGFRLAAGPPSPASSPAKGASGDEGAPGVAKPPGSDAAPASRPSRPVQAREEEIAPGIKVRFLYCPPGKFIMGEGAEAHKVTLTQGFWLAETETTQGQWQAVMKANPSRFTTLGPEAPVEQVSWNDIAGKGGFLTRIQSKAPPGLQFSLPTEAQWEYACRAGTTTSYSWSDDYVKGKANVDNDYGSTMPVKRFAPNPWGFYDLHGNVWEWCQDRYAKYFAGPATDPKGAASGSTRVYRGESWLNAAARARSSDRVRFTPDFRSTHLGFRLALAVPPSVQQKPAGPQ
ncbi:MAG: Formylglycine-generating enzyme, required for sulfatase activity [Verrucomicrobia bacterium]|nr:MAG: Formylglycine-generating enzyme, required for sulfatase activity [Verrucomicrobiota bacterium]